MTVHIWCPRPSEGAINIRDALTQEGIKCYKSGTVLSPRQVQKFISRVKPEDLWINWGTPYLVLLGVELSCTILNDVHVPWNTKRDQLIRLAECGIPCPEVFDGPGTGRIGRSANHQGGRDLIHDTGRAYYTQKLNLTSECRIHVFQGLSIHAGIKIPIPGAHPWIRSYDAGWRIDYSQHGNIKKGCRDMAKKAVKALGLDFGAVDLGITNKGKIAVLEVNLAPGLDPGQSTEAYVKQIIRVHGDT